ncbi:hypothetical protein JHK82_055182 [Glycine max]|nr:hypothetical protein JHK86_055023 [Glycine max]KAG4917715.1 hypothetical protein JHK85_055996 [Glycine max]KAG5076487.1 hypothetical protein JHK82_055182 [Glycine max]
MDELREQAKGYILIEEISIFQNEVYQARQKLDKRKANTKADLHKSDKRHKPNKRQPLSKGPRYKHYTPLTTNHTTILEEVFNLDVPIRLPKTKLPRSGSDITKYCKYHHGIDHSTEDCLALKDKIEELIQEQDQEDIKRSSTRTRKQIEEEWKIEADKDHSHNGMSDHLHQNRNPPNTSDV